MKHLFPVLLTAAWGLSLSFPCQRAMGQEPRPAKPNIVIMMADDMGLGDTSAYKGIRLAEKANPIGKTLVTPNIEKFSQRWSPSAPPVTRMNWLDCTAKLIVSSSLQNMKDSAYQF